MDGFVPTQASKNSPARQAEPFDSMSSVEIAEALEQALDSMTEETYDPALIDAYLNALDQRAPMPPPPDANVSFQALQRKLQGISPDGNTAPGNKNGGAFPAKRHPLRRMVVTLAAAMALLFALMIGAQAAGMDIFGNLARWTDEHLYFIFSSGDNARNVETHDLFQKALKDCGLPTDLAPSWYPKGYTSELAVWKDESSSNAFVQLVFSNDSGKEFVVSVDRYEDVESIKTLIEKDLEPVDTYTKGNRTFYIYSNVNIVSAVLSNDDLMVTIRGDLSIDEVKKMINSMGG